jgi:hypothetical protein
LWEKVLKFSGGFKISFIENEGMALGTETPGA